MGLIAAQLSVVIKCSSVANGEPFQGVIQIMGIMEIEIYLGDDIEIPMGAPLTISFWDNESSYEFKSFSVQDKPSAEKILKIARPKQVTRLVTRKFERLRTKIPVSYKLIQGTRNERGILLNISGGGALLATHHPLMDRDTIAVTLRSPGKPNEKIEGRVVWIKSGQATHDALKFYGLEFENLSEIRRDALKAFVLEIFEVRRYWAEEERVKKIG